jgi:hypothetical protein
MKVTLSASLPFSSCSGSVTSGVAGEKWRAGPFFRQMNAGSCVGARGVWVFVGKLVQRSKAFLQPLASCQSTPSLSVALRLPICAFLGPHARLFLVASQYFCPPPPPPPTKPCAIICCIVLLFSLAFSCFSSLSLSLSLSDSSSPNPSPAFTLW